MSEPKIKKISINPDIFSLGSSNSRKNKKPDKPLKIKEIVKPSNKTRKREILQLIRAKQEKQYKILSNDDDDKKFEKNNNSSTEFNNSFDESIKFMESVVENREKIHLNQTLKSRPPISISQPMRLSPPMSMTGESNKPQSLLFHEDPNISKFGDDNLNLLDTINDNNDFSGRFPTNGGGFNPIIPSPKYGCLKNGVLPTYRNYTMKNTSAITHGGNNLGSRSHTNNVQSNINHLQSTPSNGFQPNLNNHQSGLSPAPNNIVGRIRSPEEVIEMKKLREISLEAKKTKPKIIHKKVHKLMKRTFRIGRDRYKPAVGVLLPNKTIKNDVTIKTYVLKQTPMAEIRKFLLKTGFIKVGSAAPNDVLRKIYESIKLIDGDVNNHNPDNLLYNFFNDKDK